MGGMNRTISPDKLEAFNRRLRAFHAESGSMPFATLLYESRKLYESALRLGVIVPPPACEHCDAVCRVHGHHYNYGLPISVQWLCHSCHRFAHSLQTGKARRTNPRLVRGVHVPSHLAPRIPKQLPLPFV